MSNSTVQNVNANEVRMIAKGTYFLLVRLLQSKSYDDNAPLIDAEGVVVRYSDDSPITFGDLRNCRVAEAVRKDGSVGPDYPLLWELTQGEAQGAIDWLNTKSAKPNEGAKQFRPKAGKAKAEPRVQQREPVPAKPEIDLAEIVRLEIAKAMQGVYREEAAKPQPGHKLVRQSPTPKELQVPQFSPGDVIMVNGVAVQISADGKRLNKTIV
jgi:hypothetical protein